MQPTQANPGDQMMEKPDAAPFTVCIDCNPDGTFAVGLKSEAPAEGMEGMDGGEMAGAGMKPARDVKEALTSLGYGPDEIKLALAAVPSNADADSGALLKLALRALAGD